VGSRYRLLACDFDRTLTEHPRGLHVDLPGALARARAAGNKVVVCSGQPVAVLQKALPDLDAYIAENGTLIEGESLLPHRHPWPERDALLGALRGVGVPCRAFDVILDVPRTHERAVVELLRLFPGSMAVPNVDALNLQPAGTHKGVGLAEAQRALGVPREATIAVGDGENDVAMFRQAGLAAAVANATPAARAAAHVLLPHANGEGVRWLVDEWLAGRLDERGPAELE
jgi:hydroxymethylpyrimidine pyrophosphatase-like HAD family hydrolase